MDEGTGQELDLPGVGFKVGIRTDVNIEGIDY